MLGPADSVQNQELWNSGNKQESIFSHRDAGGSTDLIADLEAKLEELEDLCGRLSFSIREVNSVMKAKSTSY
ncbi:MAG: hypothetical protein RJB66_925 [Pseudomonadota bacterium]|jgi:hypothetical protein